MSAFGQEEEESVRSVLFSFLAVFVATAAVAVIMIAFGDGGNLDVVPVVEVHFFQV
jgi:hypothetical protein